MSAVEKLPRSSVDSVAAAFLATGAKMRPLGAILYAELCARVPADPELLAIASHSLATGTAVQFLAAVHYLLLRDPRDPLAQYYATLTNAPASPGQAFPDFARFCKKHRDELLQIIETRTVQMTYAERCQTILAPLSHVARLAGEPLNLIEIGCSAGVLLTLDKYAYRLRGRGGLLGSAEAPLTLGVDVRGGPEVHIPRIGRRIGIDLCPVDVRLEDERRWLLAQCVPEWRERQSRLATALDVIARTDINMFKGDALDLLPGLIRSSPGPLCVYHSACLVYWSPDAKAALEMLLLEASQGRELYRIGIELPEPRPASTSAVFAEVVIARYRDGAVDGNVVAHSSADNGTFTWIV